MTVSVKLVLRSWSSSPVVGTDDGISSLWKRILGVLPSTDMLHQKKQGRRRREEDPHCAAENRFGAKRVDPHYFHSATMTEAMTALEKRVQALEVGAKYDATKEDVKKVEREYLIKLREIRAAMVAGGSRASSKQVFFYIDAKINDLT